ncbi:hypothetical protein KBC86_02415, partial [Candidatus Gracilibacteria bacterium]|nr:hypothetical protein [Candidatus Gracilibacteria bacterium]
YKAMDFTQKQLQNTPIVMKTVDEYKDFLTKKRIILIAYDEKSLESREILMRTPLWSTQAWSDAAEIRFVETSKESELTTHLAIQTAVDMKVWYIGEETFHGSDVASIMKWWEKRCYDGKYEDTPKDEKKETTAPDITQPQTETNVEAKPEPIPETVDPLAGK